MEIVDYPNGKFQGSLNSQAQPQGPGILLTDDLVFTASHWNRNQLSGPTLLYLPHAHYIYGHWKHNQPQGLNVFRTADTVLLGEFQGGIPSGRCLLILERQSLAWVLDVSQDQWTVLQGGPLPNHKALLEYLQQIGLNVPDHYFSLTKFVCSFSQSSKHIKTYPCGSSHCYFGFLQGLAIIFDHNNAVVSVGWHQNQQLCELGGKFEGERVVEGNFQSGGQRVSYQGDRPVDQIGSIFSGLHQRSRSFDNKVVESTHKVYEKVQNVLREKIQKIAALVENETGVNVHPIRDSLNFRDFEEEESLERSQKNKRMYSPLKKVPGTNAPHNNTIQRSMPLHREAKPSRPSIDLHSNQEDDKNIHPRGSLLTQGGHLIDEPQLISEFFRKTFQQAKSREGESKSRGEAKSSKMGDQNQRSPTFKGLIEQIQSKYKIGCPSLNYTKEREGESRKVPEKGPRRPSFRKEDQNLAPERKSSSKKKFDIKAITRPTYQEIEERRKRVLKEFKELNQSHSCNRKAPEEPKHKAAEGLKQNHGKGRKESSDSSFGYVPLSISQKKEKGESRWKHLQLRSQEEWLGQQKKGRRVVQILGGAPVQEKVKEKHEVVLTKSFQKLLECDASSRTISKSKIDPEEGKKERQVSSSVSPSRQKKTYVYLFE